MPSRVAERLMRYVQVDTQSDPQSSSFPSTEKQKDLARMLATELQAMGVADAAMDEWGYVYATIPATASFNIPTICFCAHMDTEPGCSGSGVKPILHPAWNGTDIVLPDDTSQVIRVTEHPYLHHKIGEDLITASGTTLLGADDKAGVAIIMELAFRLQSEQIFPHGTVKILFTPDEEIGRGVDKVNLGKLAADYAYTLDGSELGSLEDETFSADAVEIVFTGIPTHPGSAKGKMVNALKVAARFVNSLPTATGSPETTEGMEGFVHPVNLSGTAEQAIVGCIVRDFDTTMLAAREAVLRSLAESALMEYPGSTMRFTVTEQYRNMKEVLDQHPEPVAVAEAAILACGITPKRMSIRGGTDGARLSFMGLPCPNLFTGEMNLHSKLEYVTVQDMEKSVEVCLKILEGWAGISKDK